MTEKQLKQDIEFLALRQLRAGCFGGGAPRNVGLSSNSIVAVIYGVAKDTQLFMPSDADDLAACQRMYEKLPSHRKGPGSKADECMDIVRTYNKTEK